MPRVLEVSLALRVDHGVFNLEKWYLDTLLADGGLLLLYAGRIRLFGLSMARFTAELHRPGKQAVRSGAVVRHPRGGDDWLRFGPLRIEKERVTWRTDGFSGDLQFRARAAATVLRTPFLERGGRRIEWTVEVPDADVRGTCHWPGGEASLQGRGYRDRVWFDFLPWRFPIRELLWGRAVTRSHAATWVEARCPDASVRCDWMDGELLESRAPVELASSNPVIQTPVVDVEGLRLGFLRGPLRALSGDPHQTKYLASARIAAETGSAIHEVVSWH
jgi:hypothetical protein